jgi:GIY-YIG catalytic domain
MSTYVYRLRDCQGTTLYIGVTDNPVRRLAARDHVEHLWRPYVCTVDIERFDNDEDARIAERLAILSEYPVFNMNDRSPLHPDGPSLRSQPHAALARYLTHRSKIPA